jgi:hypothetical protein
MYDFFIFDTTFIKKLHKKQKVVCKNEKVVCPVVCSYKEVVCKNQIYKEIQNYK